MAKRKPERIGDVLRDYLHSSGLGRSLQHAEIYSVWDEIVGRELCAHTRAAGFKRYKLYVDVDSAAHRQELATYHKQQLLEDLRARLPKIRIEDIVFRPAPVNRTSDARAR
jgi:hypothetical protein